VEAARDILCELVVEHGPSLAADPRRLRALLNDLCGEETKAVFVLTAAAQARIPADLAASHRAAALHVQRGARRLSEELGFAEEVAHWAAETWALALGAARGSDAAGSAGAPHAPITVCAQGRGVFTSLARALRAAPAWSRIEVLPGLYAEPLTIDRPIEIVATGRPGETIVQAEGASCLRLRAEYALVRGLTLTGQGGTTAARTLFGVDVPVGELYLEDCDVSGAELACVAVHGRAASATLRRCRVTRGRQAGLYVSLGGAAHVTDCEILEHGGAGVEIGWQGAPTLRRCRINGNGTYGIRIFAGGESQVEDCDLTANRLGAWSVEEAA
jgi:hypothetical protein